MISYEPFWDYLIYKGVNETSNSANRFYGKRYAHIIGDKNTLIYALKKENRKILILKTI